MAALPLLDPREEHHRIDSPEPGLSLFLRHLEPARSGAHRGPVLYVHGATFPSAQSIAHRFDGRSWRDALCEAGYDVWSFDFLGFGGSDRYPAMKEPATSQVPLCCAADAAKQIDATVRFILERTKFGRLSIVSHSWGGTPACLFAGAYPDFIDRLVLFAPIGVREGPNQAMPPAWRDVTLEEQWTRFVEDVPSNEAAVLSRRHFDEWGQAYLASDPESLSRTPPAVRVPNGPTADNLAAFAGQGAYDPALVRAPVAIIRGAWDHLVTDADAHRLFEAFENSPSRRDVKISRGTHLMHLEAMRLALWRETIAFLDGNDVALPPN
jgi:pimeloyl-ACP methyl ester carboxylesterase